MKNSEEWEDEEDFDAEFAAEADDPDDDEPTIRCPYCRQEIHEDALRCPHCEKYISREDAPAAAKPWWIGLGVAVVLYIIFRWIVG